MLNITEIRIKLARRQTDKLRAFACVTFDGALVVRDIKVIARDGRLFAAMPSRKLCDRCPTCKGKNYVRASYCNVCGVTLARHREEMDERGRARLYADIAHPINQKSRDFIQDHILAAYEAELEASKQEGYVETLFEDMDYEEVEELD